jgi:MerR family transcriptional regulator/heat shock protein HspR
MISVAAELAGVHPQTLRAYEQKGLVTPKRTSGGTRMYSQADLDRLALISQLTDEGINLAGVTRILDLQTRLEAAQEENANLHKKVRTLVRRLNELDPSTQSTGLVRVADMPPVFHWLTNTQATIRFFAKE